MPDAHNKVTVGHQRRQGKERPSCQVLGSLLGWFATASGGKGAAHLFLVGPGILVRLAQGVGESLAAAARDSIPAEGAEAGPIGPVSVSGPERARHQASKSSRR